MKAFRASRVVVTLAALALAAVAFSAVALAGARDDTHPKLMPTKLVGVPELSAVVWNAPTKSFVQFQVDRGKVTAISGNTVTIQQHQLTNVWRTQSFTIHATADIYVNGRLVSNGTTAQGTTSGTATTPLSRVKVGMHARIVQTGPVGGSLQIVRLDVNRLDLPLPTAAG
jgi:hypothetical protein